MNRGRIRGWKQGKEEEPCEAYGRPSPPDWVGKVEQIREEGRRAGHKIREVHLGRSSRETGVAGLYGRANLTLWLVVKGGR